MDQLSRCTMTPFPMQGTDGFLMPTVTMSTPSSKPSKATPRRRPTRVVCVASGKGGVGKTSVTVNLAQALVRHHQKILVMDADLSLANVCVSLGLRPSKNLAHVISGEYSLQDVILAGPEGIQIIPASTGLQRMSTLRPTEYVGIVSAFSQLQNVPDILLVDLAPGICDNVVNFCRAAHDVIVVMCDEPTSFADASVLIKVLSQDYGVQRFHILLNRVSSQKLGHDAYLRFMRASEQSLEITPYFFGAVPEDSKLKRAVKTQSAVVSAYPHSPSAVAFNALSEQLLHWPRPSGSGGLQFFVEQVVTAD